MATMTLSHDAEQAEHRPPQHRHHNHGADCSSPGVSSLTHLGTRHVPAAIALPAPFGETAIAPATQGRNPPGDLAPAARPGRSTQIRFCMWRI
ncbi:hypothetical protein [Streptomyces sp. NPDC026092]|uniref:hypothetical protein n=1 Tax=Streptomyces sp. NPDC026092 TaxID=3154797 RepID=UPI0033FCE37A